jgi:hypothetical protein
MSQLYPPELREEGPPQDVALYEYDDDGRPVGWTTVATFFNVEDANLACLQLDEQDIPSYISGEWMTATAWHYALATGGAQVQVPHDFVERARAVLQPPAKPEVADFVNHAGCCPRCASTQTRDARTARRIGGTLLLAVMIGANPVLGGLALLLGLCVLMMTRYRTCRECGFIWRGSTARGFEMVTPESNDPEE